MDQSARRLRGPTLRTSCSAKLLLSGAFVRVADAWDNVHDAVQYLVTYGRSSASLGAIRAIGISSGGDAGVFSYCEGSFTPANVRNTDTDSVWESREKWHGVQNRCWSAWKLCLPRPGPNKP